MVHRLLEENTRSDLSTVLVGSSNAFNMATMLPIAWEETYQESVGIREDVHHLVHAETFRCTTIMPNIKNWANNTELATIKIGRAHV